MGPEWDICPKQDFFLKNQQHLFDIPLCPFHTAKFIKKMLRA